MNEWFWVWLALVVIFTVAEIIEGGGFVGPWAVGAAVAALFELLSLPIEAQWIAFIGVSSVLVVAWRRTFHPIQRAAHAATEPEEDS